ncbi:tagatose-diphosphate aldolase [Phlyctema vagabunda]|uniref:Fructose-bisphosphate aldolase n=1 Tax=Phlyctema vagabunda TaxID=108571 RepID=A0ABR4PBA6_9HELO
MSKQNRTVEILKNASRNSYGVLAAIVYNVEYITAYVRAAESRRSPLIILFFPSTLKQLPSLVYAARAAADLASVPISVHVDHAQDVEQIRQIATELPVDSIMIDMSHYEEEENLAKTKTLGALCHGNGKAIEAESGRIEGGEDGIADTAELEDVENFLAADIDILAPSIGNIHGDYGHRGPQLDLERLRQIRQQINGRVEIALHGTNDFTPQLMKECIAAGATKINVNKLLLEVWNVHLFRNVNKPLSQLIEDGIEILQKEVEHWMDIVGSSGKA